MTKIERKEMTIDEIKALPGLLGIMASQIVQQNGEYKCTISGVKTLIVLAK